MDALPKKSRILVTDERGVRKITILPSKAPSLMAGIILLSYFSLVILESIIDQDRVKGPYSSIDFLSGYGLFILVVFGIVIFLLTLLNTRRLFAETLLLRTRDMVYNPGSLDTITEGYRTRKGYSGRCRKSADLTFDREQLSTLKLTEFTGFNKLTIELENGYFEMAVDISNLEREWLYRVIKAHYSL